MNIQGVRSRAAIARCVPRFCFGGGKRSPLRFFDPLTHGMVTYDPDRHREPPAHARSEIRAQMVNFETTEAPGTVIVDSATSSSTSS